MLFFCFTCIISLLICQFPANSIDIDEIFVPATCESIVKPGDHLLIEYSIIFKNGTEAFSLKRPEQLFHIILESSNDASSISFGIKGMCRNSTRKLTFESGAKLRLPPLVYTGSPLTSEPNEISILITLVHVTDPADYQIFSHLLEGNITAVVEMIQAHHGVNAVDEWGESPLMVAVRTDSLTVISSLLNARMPKVDVNFVKASGYTALMYSVMLNQPTILSALLRRGADPNLTVQQPRAQGSTALHFACSQEKQKHSQLLLQYGAQPLARTAQGLTPLQMLPADAVRSTRLHFQKMFQEAMLRTASQTDEGLGAEL